jgi:hypothetical protein
MIVYSLKVVQEERDYLQLFPKNQLVYLSPESNNILRFIDPERVTTTSIVLLRCSI